MLSAYASETTSEFASSSLSLGNITDIWMGCWMSSVFLQVNFRSCWITILRAFTSSWRLWCSSSNGPKSKEHLLIRWERLEQSCFSWSQSKSFNSLSDLHCQFFWQDLPYAWGTLGSCAGLGPVTSLVVLFSPSSEAWKESGGEPPRDAFASFVDAEDSVMTEPCWWTLQLSWLASLASVAIILRLVPWGYGR